jgi:hypothetical protein
MTEIMKEKAGKGSDHEDGHGMGAPTAPKWSKWKALAAAVGLATSVGTVQAGCGSGNNDSVVSIPSDGGCTTDGDAACTDADGGQGGMDSGAGGMDAGQMDAGHDNDAGMDAGPVDAGPVDAGPVDAGMDSGSDGGSCGVASTGYYNGFISTKITASVGGYSVAFDSLSGSDVLVDVHLGSCGIASSYHCPIGSTTNIDDNVNHKELQVHVLSGSATFSQVQITVVNH